MKQIQLFLFCLLISTATMAQNETVHKLKTDVESTVIFLEGAEITRNTSVTLKQGRNKLIFEGLTPSLNAKSIRITANEEVSILAISSKVNYLTKVNDKPRIKQIKDSIKINKMKLTDYADVYNAYNSEKDLLLENSKLGGANTGVSVAEIKQAADYYRSRLMEINKLMTENIRVQSELTIENKRMNSELNELNASISYPRTEVHILVSVEQDLKSDFELKYLTNKAGWAPTYDIKAGDLTKPVDLVYRAKVFNNTKIDWEDVKLTLSTADPNRSAAKPEMTPWYLNYESYQYSNSMNMELNQQLGYAQNSFNWSVAQEESDDFGGELDDYISTGNLTDSEYTEIEVSQLNADFEIEIPYNIPSDNKPYLVDIVEYKLPATYKHFSVPKIDRDAFLIAKITGWEDLNFVEGPANVYFAGTFVGESYIYTRNVKDTLDISLGRDKKVLVTRSKLVNNSGTKLIGSKRKKTVAFEMIVKNNRSTPIEIEILDQLPVSQDEDIEVKSLEISGADLDILKGELSWKYSLQPKESKKINLSFSVTYPKGKEIQMKQSQKRYMRKF